MRRFLLAAVMVLLSASSSWAQTPSADSLPELTVSRRLAEARGLAVGDVVALSTSAEGLDPRSFRIVGLHESAPDPMEISRRRWGVRLHLPDMLALQDAGEAVNVINVELAEGASEEEFIAGVTASSPFLQARSTHGASGQAPSFRVLESFHFAVAAITMLGSTAFLLALMVMRAEERRDTMGLLRLLGVRRRRIALASFLEGLLVAVPGAILGVVIALLAQGAVNRFFQWHYDTTLIFVRVTPELALTCVVVAIPLGVLAGFLAAAPLLRQDVMSLQRR